MLFSFLSFLFFFGVNVLRFSYFFIDGFFFFFLVVFLLFRTLILILQFTSAYALEYIVRLLRTWLIRVFAVELRNFILRIS